MLITFTSAAGPNVLMFGEVATQLLEVMGKSPRPPGVVTVEQMGQVLGLLRRAADASRNRAASSQPGGDASDEAHGRPGDDRRSSISLAQRAQPLIDLLERSQRAGQPVVWR